MSEFLKLAERCEQASGPDRELDREIRDCVFQPCINNGAPYTDSLDAAMMLVPEGLCLRMGIGTLMGKYSAVTEIVRGNAVELLVSFVGETVAIGDAATPALALCAASLRARSAQP